jgi:hypothetical protein
MHMGVEHKQRVDIYQYCNNLFHILLKRSKECEYLYICMTHSAYLLLSCLRKIFDGQMSMVLQHSELARQTKLE